MKQYLLLAITGIVLSCLSACTRNADADTTLGNGSDLVQISTRVPIYSGLEQAAGDDSYEDLTAYLFVNNVFKEKRVVADNILTIAVDKKQINKLFFVANSTQFEELASLKVGSSDSSIFSSAQTTSSTVDGGAKMFMVSSMDINTADTKRTINLTRGVARLDISPNSADIAITTVRIENTVAQSLLLPGSLSKPATTSYTKTLATPSTAKVPGVFYLYEHSKLANCTVEVDAMYAGKMYTVRALLPETITRNTVYGVVVKPSATLGKLDFDITTNPWGVGDVVDATPDTDLTITLDPTTTQLPDTVVADYTKSTITVPGNGSTFILGLKSDYPIDIIPQGNAPSIRMTPIAGAKNRFQVTVDPQPWNSDAYSARYALKNPLLDNTYDYLLIEVKNKLYNIPTVMVGGLEWMAFNSLGRNGLDQTRVSAGQSIEEVYQTRFSDAMGYYIHWGRPHVFKPWEHTVPNIGGGNMWKDSVTCPPRFRVPKIADYKKIFPAGTTIPSTYKVNGIDFQTYVVSPATQATLPNGAKVAGRYLVIEEINTARKLFLPFSGHKGDKNSGVGWSMGDEMWLWVLDTSSTGGYAQVFKVTGGAAPKAAYDILQMDAFATLRCVKE